MEPINRKYDLKAIFKPVVIPCIAVKQRYHAIGKKLSFEISWHFGHKCVEVFVEELNSYGSWDAVMPGKYIMANTCCMDWRMRFFWNSDPNADINWLKAIEYIEEEYGFTPILKGVNDNVQDQI